ncbi:MAG TPA: ATP-binding cassette domain-containing protein, partial [Pararhizobium sp.]|nr:ATP-binding cassette domain-containing protein [Pararhizobium sp.]
FRYLIQDPNFGLTIRNLKLAHGGFGEEPFLTAANLHFKRGEWTFVKGESGCGKTSLVKAINGLWPHGSGAIVMPKGVETFYAAQEVKLPQVSLKELACLPGLPDGHEDKAVASALRKAGLGDFAGDLAEEGREGKIWDQMLSGGQKQKLVVTRILLQQPGLLFLDEATAALDPEGKREFHQTIKDNCPGITVISIMHEAVAPKTETGEEFFDSMLSIADGVALKKALVPPLPAEITSVLDKPRSGKAGHLLLLPVHSKAD